VSGSISAGVPKARFSAELGKKIAEHLEDACRRLSDTLEAVGYPH
jgi:DNA-binding IclR family transcriptional regulator